MVLEVSKPNVDLSKIDSKNAIVYNNPSELPIELQNRVIKKLKSQNLNINSRGILFKSSSGTSQRIKESKEFKNLIYNISFDYSVSNDHLITGKDTSILLTGRNLFFAFKKVDVVDNKIIDNNKFSCYIIDTTDYNAKDPNNLVIAARSLQLLGKLVPVFILVETELTKDELEQIKKSQ